MAYRGVVLVADPDRQNNKPKCQRDLLKGTILPFDTLDQGLGQTHKPTIILSTARVGYIDEFSPLLEPILDRHG